MKVWDRLFHDGAEVEAARRNDTPSGGNEFILGGSLVACGQLFFSGLWPLGEFLREDLIGEKSEYWNSDLNESTSLW